MTCGSILTLMKGIPLLLLTIASSWHFAVAQPPAVLVLPESPMQGEPVLISLPGIKNLSDVRSITFDSLVLPVFLHQNRPTAFVGLSLTSKPGNHTVTVSLSSGETLKRTVVVGERKKETRPLGIPEKMGGNTAASQKRLAASLEKENLLLDKLVTNKKKLWTENFVFPLADPAVTDPYGYTRETGSYAIAHRGTDFRAASGTKVSSMNRGVVRLARYSPVYGNTVVVDHGMGLMTFYMHLSKTYVAAGQLVRRGQLLGLSGQTGYATGPHLHLSVRINNVSIDPMKFMEFFK